MNKRLSLPVMSQRFRPRPSSAQGERDLINARLESISRTAMAEIDLKTMVMHGIELTEERLKYFKDTFKIPSGIIRQKYNFLIALSQGKANA